MARIMTITLNPALDLNADLQTLTPGQVNRTTATSLDAAGKGLNVARVLARLGHRVTVTGLLGEDNAAPFERLFADAGLDDSFVRIPGENRINIKIAEQGGRVTDLNGAGFQIPADALKCLEFRLAPLIPEHDVIVIGGSLPANMPPSAVAELVTMVRQAGKPVWLDTSGEALVHGLAATPDAIKPNLEELSAWAGRALTSRREVADVAARLQAQGITQVIVSLGPDGVLWFGPEGRYRSLPPPVSVLSTVCAGDTLLAGMLHGQLLPGEQRNPTQRLQFATALSAECVRHAGVGDPAAPDFTTLLDNTRVYPWPGDNNHGEMPL
ncbi:1-phosphofructokinase [Marinobacter sp. M216]|uniref:Phosphofructokinase n=1 Tax=Marinobacter albus TaxID=3030833 RepID=A0ABT7HDA4_9GAMM|nr:1-phosphofructokinase [Marinobacter sp. M216]MDK9558338.1 1-phosphofructokinase [Marinobacter sp. M216]